MKTDTLKTIYLSQKSNNMKLHVIVVAYERPIPLRGLIDSFLNQTCQDWEMDIVHDGPASKSVWNVIELYKDKRIRFWESKIRYENYGHPNRACMLQKIKGNKYDYVLITNDDNYYVPKFVEYFLAECDPKVGIVYCDTVHSHCNYAVHYSKLKEQGIDMGAFIVRLDIAKKTGFNHIHFSADGKYAEECNMTRYEKGLRNVYIQKPLFIHN